MSTNVTTGKDALAAVIIDRFDLAVATGLATHCYVAARLYLKAVASGVASRTEQLDKALGHLVNIGGLSSNELTSIAADVGLAGNTVGMAPTPVSRMTEMRSAS